VISSIEITRLRGIRQGKLEDLSPLVVLVGPNGCGKSSILDALFIAANPNPQAGATEAVKRHHGLYLGARWFLWRADEGTEAMITVRTSEASSRTCVLKAQPNKTLHCSREAWQRAVQQDLPSVESGSEEPVGVPEVRLIEPRIIDGEPSLHKLYAETVRQGRRDNANAIIREIVPGLSHLEILTEGNVPILHLVFDDHSVPAALAGDGVYSLVRLCLELASRPRGVVLIEEPEVHQHPGAIRQTVRAILAAVRRDIQVILTTHSLELIDLLLAESSDADLEKLSLYRLALREGALIARRMPGSEVAFVRAEIESDLR